MDSLVRRIKLQIAPASTSQGGPAHPCFYPTESGAAESHRRLPILEGYFGLKLTNSSYQSVLYWSVSPTWNFPNRGHACDWRPLTFKNLCCGACELATSPQRLQAYHLNPKAFPCSYFTIRACLHFFVAAAFCVVLPLNILVRVPLIFVQT